jgi:hypothetical protein
MHLLGMSQFGFDRCCNFQYDPTTLHCPLKDETCLFFRLFAHVLGVRSRPYTHPTVAGEASTAKRTAGSV